MKAVVFAACLLFGACADAQVCRCPPRYPEAGASAILLSNAAIYLGEMHGQNFVHGDIEEVHGGTDTHYSLPEGVPHWLVCQYGGRRIVGTAIRSTHVDGSRDWWIALDLLVDACDLKIRQTESNGHDGASTATAICRHKEPPPPVMLQ